MQMVGGRGPAWPHCNGIHGGSSRCHGDSRAAIIIASMAHNLLGALSRAAFLRHHWQKRPLFVRNALPDCGSWLQPQMLFEWATRDDVESRLVMRTNGRWTLQHGPFRHTELRALPARGWALLVQGVEQLHAHGAALLQRFAFLPHARLDDLMVSYAPAGGGVGPHFDSYDVFLLQGSGTRRWQISAQRDHTLVANAPLRILRHFRPTREWVTTQGDLLYLPPNYAHEGVALEPCMTLSVGFRAPRHQELATQFLNFLQDELKLDGMYEDRNLRVQPHPGEIPRDMLRQFAHVLQRLRWNAADVRRFAGRYLTEPKAHIVFKPRPAPAAAIFKQRIGRRGVRLALATRMLVSSDQVFINGECQTIQARDRAALLHLADRRAIPAATAALVSVAAAALFRAWYRAGYIEFGAT